MATKAARAEGERQTAQSEERRSLPENRGRRRKMIVVAVIVAALSCIIAAYALIHSAVENKKNENVVEASGRIEVEENHIVSPMATRISSVRVREGDSVKKGELLVVLDARMVKEKIGIADSALRQARSAEGRAAQQERAVNGEVAVVQKKSRGFWAKLFSTKAGRAKKAADLRRDVLTAKMASMQARAAAMRAAAMKHEAASSLSFFNLTSPINGMIETRSVEPGDLVDKGQVLLSVIDPRKAYLRAFVAEGELSRLHVGQPAKVYLDSNEKLAPLSGRLIEIDSAPSFTPQNVYFKDDRVRQTFGLKISLDHPEGLAKPGMRGDAKITVAKASGGNQK